MKKLNLIELGKKILTRNNNSIISNILNKSSLNQTGTTDYSNSQNESLNEINRYQNFGRRK